MRRVSEAMMAKQAPFLIPKQSKIESEMRFVADFLRRIRSRRRFFVGLGLGRHLLPLELDRNRKIGRHNPATNFVEWVQISFRLPIVQIMKKYG